MGELNKKRNRTMVSRIAVFDLDGTLTPARKPATEEMMDFLAKLKKNVPVAIVSGSDEPKLTWQLNNKAHELCDYLFFENGVVAYQHGKLLGSESLTKHLGEEKYKKLINFALVYIAELDIPVKRGTFIELRTGMVNICPIGRNCSYEERLEFSKLDQQNGIRAKMVEAFNQKFHDYNLTFSIGGQISIDCFPKGWDKRYCLKYLQEYKEIHFFGDKTQPGENDYEIFSDPRTFGYKVTDPKDTIEQVSAVFKVT